MRCRRIRNTKVKSQVGEGLAQAEPAKLAVIKYRQQSNRWPAGNAKAGLPAPDQLGGSAHVDSITVLGDGRIAVHFGTTPPHKADKLIAGKTLILTPSANTGTHWTWVCAADDIADKYLPAQCKSPD